MALKKEYELINRKIILMNAEKRLEEMYTDMIYLNKTKTWIEPTVKQQALNSVNETLSWLKARNEAQEKLDEWEMPVLKTSTVEAKVNGVEQKIKIIRDTLRPRKTEL